ncbi:MAG: sigma-70 family RNA polymerase sigma factor [Rhodospirillales bacterium]|nr:sigma-70 family RNA polymerase sigma factor [Rhodospirillales bacterium]
MKPAANDHEQLWRDWACKAQNGDSKSYNALLNALLPYIRNILSGGLANADWVEDITQEVLISVHKSLHTYSPDRPFKPWLGAIINFRRTDFLRKYYQEGNKRQAALDDTNIYQKHVTDPAYAGELKDMEQALAQLPEQQRKVFRLMRIEGYTAQEVAEKTGMSVAAIKVSVHRSAGKLKKILGNGYE